VITIADASNTRPYFSLGCVLGISHSPIINRILSIVKITENLKNGQVQPVIIKSTECHLKHDKIYEFCPTWALQPGILIKRNDFSSSWRCGCLLRIGWMANG
jgi:hypothetical protein